jgi:hypothetical protein
MTSRYFHKTSLSDALTEQTRSVTLTEQNELRADRPAPSLNYQAPELFVIGRALDLIQADSFGKEFDGFTGYYWES